MRLASALNRIRLEQSVTDRQNIATIINMTVTFAFRSDVLEKKRKTLRESIDVQVVQDNEVNMV